MKTRRRPAGNAVATPAARAQRVQHDEVARLDGVDRATDRFDDARTFVSHDQGQRQLRDAREDLDVALTDTRREQANDHFIVAGGTQFDVIADVDAVLIEYHTSHWPRSSIGGSVQSYANAAGEAE